jgi:hypothetical protein
MADGVVEQFVSALVTRLDTITTGNGYKNTVKATRRIYKEPQGLKDDEMPLFQLGLLTVNRAEHAYRLNELTVLQEIAVVVENTAHEDDAAGGTPQITIQNLAHDVVWALTNKGTDDQSTLGTSGVVQGATLVTEEHNAPTDEGNALEARFVVQATVWEAFGDPDAGRG